MRDNQRRKWIAIAAIWTLLIIATCWLPMPMFAGNGVGQRARRIPNIDKVIHAGVFVVFGLSWLRVLSGRRRYLVVVLGGFALAAITEIGQSLPVIDRDGDFIDGAADLAGVCLACLVDYAFLKGSEVGAALSGAADV